MPNPIDDAIAAAQKAAANSVPSTTIEGTGGAVSTQRAAPLGLDDMLSGAITVDAWIKVTEHGLTIGTDRTLFDSIPVTIDMAAIAYCYSVRFGNPAQYDKTYDRLTSVKGQSWNDTLRKAQQIDEKASEFRSADLPFVLRQDLNNKKGDLIIAKDSTLGHSLSITGWKAFQEFVTLIQKQNIDPRTAVVDLDLGFDVRTNTKGTWGVLKFDNPAASEDEPE